MLTIKKVKENFDIKKIDTPVMVIDSSVIEDRYKNLKDLIDGVEIFYSVKTNSNIKILEQLRDLGSGFEVASLYELNLLKILNVPPEKIITGNTLKTPQFIREAHEYGVNYFAFDSMTELDKISKEAPDSSVSLRIAVDNTGSEWPLSKKFGASTSRALELFKYAKSKGLNPNALTFHVGSQCLNSNNWSNALITIGEIFNLARKNGFKIEIVNMGGGFPSKLDKDIPKIKTIKKNINNTIRDVFNGAQAKEKIKFYIEPGRGMVGESSIFVSKVIAKANRGSEHWLSLDIGVYNGLLEAVAGIQYEIISDKEYKNGTKNKNIKKKKRGEKYYNIGGPTCDSWDTIVKNYPLPDDMEVGDIVYVLNVGAYTLSEVTNFNGFGPPEVHFIDK